MNVYDVYCIWLRACFAALNAQPHKQEWLAQLYESMLYYDVLVLCMFYFVQAMDRVGIANFELYCHVRYVSHCNLTTLGEFKI